jgi:glutaredoxin
MIKLFNLDHCPYCRRVREKLAELGLEYEKIDVPRDKAERHMVVAVSGQASVPVLVDGEVIIADDDDKAIEYLEQKYAKG